MDEPQPEDRDIISKWHSPGRWKSEDREFDPLNFLIAVGAVLIIVLFLFVAMQLAIVDPEIRFGLLLFGLGVAAVVLISQSYKQKIRQLPFISEESHEAEGMSALQSTMDYLDLAYGGRPLGQMMALQELKELLINHLVFSKHMSRQEIMEMASDPIWLEAEINQADLRFLLTADLKLLYATELSGSEMQKGLISSFPDNYVRILEQLEEM